MVRNASRYGIYTLLDFHQDDLSAKLCGEGIPSWATKTRDFYPLRTPVPFAWPPYDVSDQNGEPDRHTCN